MRAHLVQHDIAWEDKGASRRLALGALDPSRVEPGDLVVFPEMFETGFSMRVERTCDADGAGAATFSTLARERRATVIGGVTALEADGRGRNRALAFGPDGSLLARYDKVHPFSFGREHERFSGGGAVATFRWGGLLRAAAAPGATSPGTTSDGGALVCPAICYDLRFPEIFRAGRGLGAEVFVVMANWPAERAAHWRALLIARAIENQAFVLGVNRVGADPNVKYAGGSIAVGPRGEVMEEAGAEVTTVRVALDFAVFREWRAKFPAWADAKPGLLPRLGSDGAISS